MLEHEEKYTIILAFDVKIERDAQEMADSMGVKIFQVSLQFVVFHYHRPVLGTFFFNSMIT